MDAVGKADMGALMGLREARAAVLRRWNRDLSDNFAAALPRVLDDLERADREQRPAVIGFSGEMTPEQEAEFREKFAEAQKSQPVHVLPGDPSDDEIGAWIDANPEKFEVWVRKQNRINGAPPPFDAPAKPAPRRRTRS